MSQQLQPGQQVTVNAFRGKRPTVIVVEDRGDIVLICKPEEYSNAKSGNRPPVSVGFHREDVIEVIRKGVTSQAPTEYHDSKAGD